MGVSAPERRVDGRPVSLEFKVGPDTVWAVLADGWSYPLWVVGATHMRKVDPEWPAVGARLHHSVGAWPLTIEDRTEVEDSEPGRRMVVLAHAGPAGSARVRIDLEPLNGGTRVTMIERSVKGPARFIPPLVQDAVLGLRNGESLQRLRAIAENRGPVHHDRANTQR